MSYYAKSSWLFLAMITACLEVFARDLTRHRASKETAKKPLVQAEVDLEHELEEDIPIVFNPGRH